MPDIKTFKDFMASGLKLTEFLQDDDQVDIAFIDYVRTCPVETDLEGFIQLDDVQTEGIYERLYPSFELIDGDWFYTGLQW